MLFARRKSPTKQDVLARLPVVTGHWPFADEPSTGCIVSRGLMLGNSAAESVLHEHDGDWVFLDDSDPVEANLMYVCLEDVARKHPVVGAVGSLPVGWRADMDFDVPEWVVSPLDLTDD